MSTSPALGFFDLLCLVKIKWTYAGHCWSISLKLKRTPCFAETMLRPQGLALGAMLLILRQTLINVAELFAITHCLLQKQWNQQWYNDQHNNFQSLPLTLFTLFFKSWWRTGAGSRHVYAGGSRAVRCIELESLGNRVWLEELITQPSLDWACQRKSMNVYFPAAQITVFLLQMVRDPGANAGKVKD
jgi:hypothetical protein